MTDATRGLLSVVAAGIPAASAGALTPTNPDADGVRNPADFRCFPTKFAPGCP
jgi:hypothetical protein